jgi:RNA polymerase sigma factor (sigma-70 family)
MSDQEILKLCQTLARKYKSPQHYDDLVSEGLLVCYEILNQDPNANPAQMWRESNRRMRDYLNLDLHPLSVPNSDAARAISRGQGPSTTNHSEENLDWLKYILSADVVEIDEFMAYTGDHASKYEEHDYEAHVMSVAVTTLDQRELHILHEVYYNDKGQDELSDELEVSEATISRWKDGILHKLRDAL